MLASAFVILASAAAEESAFLRLACTFQLLTLSPYPCLSLSSVASLITLEVKTSRRTLLLNVTPEVQQIVSSSAIASGVCHLYVPHTTAGITINEADDPDVARDIEATLDRLIPHKGPYKHAEGNADSHIKASLVGSSATVLIDNGRLVLGRWQGIFFCEFDGPRSRHLLVKLAHDP